MYKSDEQKRAELKQLVVAKARDIIATNESVGKPTSQTAQLVWAALRDSKTWGIVEGPKPRDPNWQEPEEVWRMVPEVVTREPR